MCVYDVRVQAPPFVLWRRLRLSVLQNKFDVLTAVRTIRVRVSRGHTGNGNNTAGPNLSTLRPTFVVRSTLSARTAKRIHPPPGGRTRPVSLFLPSKVTPSATDLFSSLAKNGALKLTMQYTQSATVDRAKAMNATGRSQTAPKQPNQAKPCDCCKPT